MRLAGLLVVVVVVVCGLGACTESSAPPPKTAPAIPDPLMVEEQRYLQHQADAVAARERAWAGGQPIDSPGDPWSGRRTAPAAKTDIDREADEAKAQRAELAQQCEAQDAQRRTRLTELEPKVLALRAERTEAARARPEDEAWVRAHCHWENDPRYALELQRRASAGGESRYEFDDRFQGFSRSVPKCPKATSARRWQIAAEIANGLVDARMAGVGDKIVRQMEDEKVGAAEYDKLKASLAACDAVAAQPAAAPPPQVATPESLLGF